MTKKWRWRRPKFAHFGLPMCLFANWPLKLVRANAFDDPVNARLRNTEFWMAAVRLLRVSVALRVTSFWLMVGELFRLVTLRVVMLRRELPSWRLRGVTLWRIAGALIRG